MKLLCVFLLMIDYQLNSGPWYFRPFFKWNSCWGQAVTSWLDTSVSWKTTAVLFSFSCLSIFQRHNRTDHKITTTGTRSLPSWQCNFTMYWIHLFGERFSQKSVTAQAAIPKGTLVSCSLPLVDWSSRCFRRIEGKIITTSICGFLFLHAEALWISLNQR